MVCASGPPVIEAGACIPGGIEQRFPAEEGAVVAGEPALIGLDGAFILGPTEAEESGRPGLSLGLPNTVSSSICWFWAVFGLRPCAR